VVGQVGRRDVVHIAWKPVGERIHRELQREAQGRTVEWGDILHGARGKGVDRDVASALQSGPTTQLAGLPTASTGGGSRTANRNRILTWDVVTKVGAGQDGSAV
jgi:hypothetical protein